MKSASRIKLAKVAEILGVYITQDRNGFVRFWLIKPTIDPATMRWIGDSSYPINRERVIHPYATDWMNSLITPRTFKYMEAGK